jgi:hypothetical protein
VQADQDLILSASASGSVVVGPIMNVHDLMLQGNTLSNVNTDNNVQLGLVEARRRMFWISRHSVETKNIGLSSAV